jgi:hypothetical protein
MILNSMVDGGPSAFDRNRSIVGNHLGKNASRLLVGLTGFALGILFPHA